jgi:imidazolonepropionase-like amidohydrolase
MDALVIDDVTLFDGSGSTPDPKSSVLVVDGVIRSVGLSGSFRAPQGAQVLSVRGRFLMPGLVDLHTHMITRDAFDFLAKLGGRMRQGDPERFLRWFPAFGVTTVRDIGNYHGIFRLRDRVASSRLVGPRIYAAEELLEGPRAIWPLSRTFRTPREAVREVRRQAAMGADWLKLYVNVPPSLARVAIREGRRLGVPVAGHLGSTTARQAAAYGIDSLEHATTLIDDGFLSPKWRAKTPRGSDIAIVRARNRFWWLHADFDGPAMRDLVAKLRRNRVVVSPTMVVHENILAGPDREFERYGLRPMPDRWMDAWVGRLKTMLPKGRPLSSGPAIFRRLRTFIGRLRRAGVTVIPSTDAAGWNPYSAPGATLHRELAILKGCGYTNRELLAMATSGAARALHREWEFGSIAPGRSADLLLLRGNPLDDLANLRRIETVFLRGRPYDPARLRS